MRFLTPSQSASILVSTRLAVSDSGGLIRAPGIAREQQRLAAGPTRDIERLGYFVETLLRWLPGSRGRLLWIDSETAYPILGSAFAALMVMRRGLGEIRALDEAPGHYIGPFSWSWDQADITAEQTADTAIMAGMLFMAMGSGWHAWLAAEGCSDILELWEGNVLFYSSHAAKIADARDILREFDCRLEMR